MSLVHPPPSDDRVDKAALLKRIAEQEQANLELEQQLALLKEQIAWFRKQVFGRSSEKQSTDANPRQGQLFNEVEAIAVRNPDADEAVAIPAHTRKKKGRKPIPKDLPRVDVIHDLPEDGKICGHDGQALTKIGEVVSEQLDFVPAKLRVLRHIRYKYVCRHCESAPITAERPVTLLPKSLASPSLLAHITTAKYVDGLPLYRQERQFERLGIALNRTTMANWMVKLGEAVQPLIERLDEACRGSPLLHMDETKIQVLKSPKAPTADHWVWVRVAGVPKQRVVLFDYDPSRGREAPTRLLKDFGGILVTDGYPVYDGIATANELRHAGCWAHARRKFHDAHQLAGQAPSTAKQALTYIGQLYRIEKRLKQKHRRQRSLSAAAIKADILQERDKASAAVLTEFQAWLEQIAPQVLPKSTLGKAVFYTLEQWPKLTTFLEHAEVPLDNNRAESAIRPYVVGRKAWLFCDTQAGAIASTNLYSLVETAKANGKEPHAYLAALYRQLPTADTSDAIDALLPWNIDLND